MSKTNKNKNENDSIKFDNNNSNNNSEEEEYENSSIITDINAHNYFYINNIGNSYPHKQSEFAKKVFSKNSSSEEEESENSSFEINEKKEEYGSNGLIIKNKKSDKKLRFYFDNKEIEYTFVTKDENEFFSSIYFINKFIDVEFFNSIQPKESINIKKIFNIKMKKFSKRNINDEIFNKISLILGGLKNYIFFYNNNKINFINKNNNNENEFYLYEVIEDRFLFQLVYGKDYLNKINFDEALKIIDNPQKIRYLDLAEKIDMQNKLNNKLNVLLNQKKQQENSFNKSLEYRKNVDNSKINQEKLNKIKKEQNLLKSKIEKNYDEINKKNSELKNLENLIEKLENNKKNINIECDESNKKYKKILEENFELMNKFNLIQNKINMIKSSYFLIPELSKFNEEEEENVQENIEIDGFVFEEIPNKKITNLINKRDYLNSLYNNQLCENCHIKFKSIIFDKCRHLYLCKSCYEQELSREKEHLKCIKCGNEGTQIQEVNYFEPENNHKKIINDESEEEEEEEEEFK